MRKYLIFICKESWKYLAFAIFFLVTKKKCFNSDILYQHCVLLNFAKLSKHPDISVILWFNSHFLHVFFDGITFFLYSFDKIFVFRGFLANFVFSHNLLTKFALIRDRLTKLALFCSFLTIRVFFPLFFHEIHVFSVALSQNVHFFHNYLPKFAFLRFFNEVRVFFCDLLTKFTFSEFFLTKFVFFAFFSRNSHFAILWQNLCSFAVL